MNKPNREQRLEQVIRQLWTLLDDIDTASDAFKGDHEEYATWVERLQSDRWNLPGVSMSTEWNGPLLVDGEPVGDWGDGDRDGRKVGDLCE